MYEIEFYENASGHSDVWEFLERLRHESETNKDSRIQFRQRILHLELLKENGKVLPENITKKIRGEIWELRPGHNRVFYFFFKEGRYVLLHHYRKKTQKTPESEIRRAESEMKDYLERKGKQ